MATIVPQTELTRRALDWLCAQGGEGAGEEALPRLIESAAVRFNLSPLEVEFLERFFAAAAKGEK